MNSPIKEIKSEKSLFSDELNETKTVNQEVNNNISTALNNNTTTSSVNTSINNDQASNSLNISNSSNPAINNSNGNANNLSNSNINSSTNSHSSTMNSNNTSNCTFEYWSQLMKDSKQLQTFSNLFMHVERLLDEEISRVRKALFQNNKPDNAPLVLPEPEGPVVQKQEKVYVPIHEHPNYNFVGRILGPRGMTAKQLEQETGCKIMIRGKGSMRNKHMEEQNRGKPNWEHLSDDLHVLIIVEDTENRAKLKIERAVEEVKKLLVPVTDGEDELKKKQLMELAIINGTYKDSNTRLLENEQLKLLPQTSPHHAAHAALAVSQQQHLTHLNHLSSQLHHTHPALRQATLNNSHASSSSAAAAAAAVAAAGSHHAGSHHSAGSVQAGHPATSIGTPLMMTTTGRQATTHPLLLGNGNSPGATQALLNENSQQALAAAAAAYLYPTHYDLGYAAQLTSASGFIEYPMQSAMAVAQAAAVAAQEANSGKQRAVSGNTRDHPYQRPSS